MNFTYEQFISRNIGFLTNEEQVKMKDAKVFIPGLGGMGGVALVCLARAGVREFIISDIDTFEVSNLNRQIFANLNTIGKDKLQIAVESLKEINPEIELSTYGVEWTQNLDKILPKVNVVVNGCDDARATVHLMRKASEHGKTVIDAFASTLPNIYVVKSHDPRPEETFSYSTFGKKLSDITEEDWSYCIEKEVEYVLTHSSTSKHVVLDVAAEMITGKRSRISFAPMVWMTGCMMSYEAVKVILNKKTLADYRGAFFNPWTFKVEKPYGKILSFFRRKIVRHFLKSLIVKDEQIDMGKLNDTN